MMVNKLCSKVQSRTRQRKPSEVPTKTVRSILWLKVPINKLEDVNEAAVKAAHGIKKRTKRVTPTAMYTKTQKKMKRGVSPCPVCEGPAEGSHQCGYCFAHVHAICALPFEGSSDGSDQRMDCGMCRVGNGEEEYTQPWVEEESLVMTK